MSTRKLLLILVPVAALLIFALLREVRDGESVAGPPTTRVLADGRLIASPSAVLPGVGVGGGPSVEPMPVSEAGETDAALQPPVVVAGSVSGRVVDGAGHAIANEPVFLTLEHDGWEPHSNPNEDDDDEPEPLVASVATDEQGEFAFTARAGVRHTLHAGGARWPRLAVKDVHAGDQLLVRLPEGFVLGGVVIEADSGVPIAGAHVLALADDNHVLGVSGPDGTFSFGQLPAQDVIVGSYAPGFDIAFKSEIAPPLGPVTLELPPGREIRGRVVDRDSGEMLTVGGEVRLQVDVLAALAGEPDRLPGKRLIEEQKVAIDPAGTFLFASGPAFSFSLLANAPGYAPLVFDRFEDRNLDPDDDIALSMRPLVPLTGTVVVADGGGVVAGARVAAANRTAEFATSSSGDDGTFTLDTIFWDGDGPVFVMAQDEAGRAGRVKVDDPHVPLVVELVPPLSVTVQVVAGGSPVAGAEVAALSEGSDATQARTGADGTVALLHPLAGPGVVAVRLQARHLDSQSLPLVIDAEQPHTEKLVLALDGGGVVSGVVLDRTGAAVPSALLRLTPDTKHSPDFAQRLVSLGYVGGTLDLGDKLPTPPLLAHADLEGRFRIAAVVPDVAYRLRVSAEGCRDGTLSPVLASATPLTVVLDPVVLWQGRLVDATSGLPMEQFIGQLQRETQTNKGLSFQSTKQRVVRKPDAPGEFSVELPEPGRFQLRLMAQDMIPALSPPVDFDGAAAPPFAALAIWPAAVLEVKVEDGRGRPVPGYGVAVIPAAAAVGAETPSGELRKQAQIVRTGQDGLARFNLGEGGSFRVGAGPGQWLDTLPVAVKPGAPQSRLYRLPPTGELEISIADELGRPLPGVRVEVRSARNEKAHAITRNAATRGVDGIVRIEVLPPGEYDVTLRRRGYETDRRLGVPVHGNTIERLAVAMKPRPKDDAPNQQPGSGGQGPGKVR